MSTKIVVERWLQRPGQEPATRDVVLELGVKGLAVSAGANGARGRLALPAPVNAHDHGYGIRTLDFGWPDDALEPWIAGMRLRPPTDPYLEALVAFGRIALSGCGITMHCHNSLNIDRLVDEAGEVVRAAKTCGIGLAFSCPLLDASPWVYGGVEALRSVLTDNEWNGIAGIIPSYAPFAEQLAAADAIIEAHAGDGIDVQYGPIGVQWASDAMLEEIADASAQTGRRIHMHLLESPRQRTWLDRRFPDGVVKHLDRIGFLSPRLAVAHGVQLRPDECELLAERGVIVVTNPSANLRLRSGVAPMADFRAAGLDVAIGLDGSGFDDDQDIWREMRLAHLLHGGRDLEPMLDVSAIFSAAISSGAKVVGQPADRDIVVADYGALIDDAIFDDLDEAEILLTRMAARHVTDLVVAGTYVVKDRKLTGFDFEAARTELAQQARAALPKWASERERARMLSGFIRRHYQREHRCTKRA